MTLDELRALIAWSTRDDWNLVDNGPIYLDQLRWVTDWSGERERRDDVCWVEVESHDPLASYKPDVDITIGWGLDTGTTVLDGVNPWPGVFAKVRWAYADVRWRGQVIDREVLLCADTGDGRVVLPAPNPAVHGASVGSPQPDLVGYTATRWSVDLARLVNDFNSGLDFEPTLARANILIEDRSG
jgi:hypothetical protein